MGRYLEIAKNATSMATVSPQEDQPVWPEKSFDCEQRFGGRFARLFPFLHKVVWTPVGNGILVQVFRERAAVLLAGQKKLTFLSPEEVLPIT